MKYAFTMPSSYVKAALLFAAQRDIRYYLNGALFTAQGAGVAVVTTDGHRAACLYHAQQVAGTFEDVIVHADDLERAIKAHGSSKLDMALQVLAPDAVNEGRRVRILCDGGRSVVECREILGKYPDWRLVFLRRGIYASPKEGEEVQPGFSINAAYMGDYAKAAKILGKRTPAIDAVQADPNSSFLIRIMGCPHFVSVMMPCRGEAAELPEWIVPAEVEPERLAA